MRRFFAYIRVSTARQGQQGSSLDEQRLAIEAYARRHGLEIAEWIEERETAAKRGRSGFSRMLKMLREGKASGVVIHKIDRSARNLRDWADLGELQDLGSEVHFANESIDLSSRGGRLSADIQAVVASDFIRNLRDEVRKGFYGRLRQGLFPKPAPIGYLNQGRGKVKTIDPATGSLVRRIFELYATGRHSLDTLTTEVNKFPWPGARRFNRNQLSRLLSNEFYIGVLHVHNTNERFEGKHEPLVLRRTFSRVQDVLQGRTKVVGWKHTYMLRALLTCSQCRRKLTGERQKGHVYYRCHDKGCRGTSVRESQISDEITRGLMACQLSPSEVTLLEAHIKDRIAYDSDELAQKIQTARLALDQTVDREKRLVDAFLDQHIDKDTYESRKHLLLKERLDTRERLVAMEAGESTVLTEVRKKFELVKGLSLGLGIENPEKTAHVAKSMSSNFFVQGKDVVIAWSFPFRSLQNRIKSPCGSPERDKLRTFAASPHWVHAFLDAFETPDGDGLAFAPPRPRKERNPRRRRNARSLRALEDFNRKRRQERMKHHAPADSAHEGGK